MYHNNEDAGDSRIQFQAEALEYFGLEIICPICGAGHDYDSWIDDEDANCWSCNALFVPADNVFDMS